jgi:hypothetical protein
LFLRSYKLKFYFLGESVNDCDRRDLGIAYYTPKYGHN